MNQQQSEAAWLRQLVQAQQAQLCQAREIGRRLVVAWLARDTDEMGRLARALRDGQWETITGGQRGNSSS